MSTPRVELAGEHPLAGDVRDFLADLVFAGKSPNTIRAYRGDLAEFAQHHGGGLELVDVAILRSYFAAIADLAVATRARKQASLGAFLRWAVRHDLVDANPLERLDRVRVPEGVPRPVDPARIARVIGVVPKPNLRDRLLWLFLKQTGCRVAEAVGVYVEDLTLTPGDEHVVIHGKGGRVRTLLLDDPQLVNLLRRFLRITGWTHGPLFRATKNWNGKPLTTSTVRELWARYRALAGEHDLELHQLRHTHATELTKDDVNPRTIQKRLGHRKLQTTLIYAEHTDEQGDAELRARQRRRGRRSVV
jgi:integrase/recombinase XerD